MLSYPYILALYRSILSQSKAINGRVFMAPFWASELNSENLGQIVADSLDGMVKKAYPLSLILPPISDGAANPVQVFSRSWEEYVINQVFLKQEARTSDGQIQDLNAFTNNSQHTITQDWHDMRRVALDFLRTFRSMMVDTDLLKTVRLSDRFPIRVVPITRLGNDRANGVLVTYRIAVLEHCDGIDDYPPDAIDNITVPVGDQHPAHPL